MISDTHPTAPQRHMENVWTKKVRAGPGTCAAGVQASWDKSTERQLQHVKLLIINIYPAMAGRENLKTKIN